MIMSSRTNTFFSNLSHFVSGSKFEDAHPPDHPVLQYGDYDIFQPRREIDAIIDNKLYLGDLPGAMSPELRASLGITHILSVCPNYPSTGPNHLQISVLDTEHENLLIHLPRACHFIQNSLNGGGRVLVHCVMGVSRSSTVVSAYLMWTRHWAAADAISFVQKRRRCIHPNYGFIRQLQAFQACGYNPSPTNDAYLAWKRRSKRDVSYFLNLLSDTIHIHPYKLYLSSEFPKDPEQGNLFLADMEISHFLTVSPSQTTTIGLSSVKHHHINISNTIQEALLLSLPDACEFIGKALTGHGYVLVHCRAEMRACIIVAACVMALQEVTPLKASSILEDALPLFQPTPNFTRHLELFAACDYAPTMDHPVVQNWMSSADPGVRTVSSDVEALNTTASRILAGTESPQASGRESPHPTGRTFDMTAFSETLARIQQTSLIGEDVA